MTYASVAGSIDVQVGDKLAWMAGITDEQLSPPAWQVKHGGVDKLLTVPLVCVCDIISY